MKAVLFDLDGTLLDSIPHILACFDHTLRVHRGRGPGPAFFMRHLGRPLRTHLVEAGAGDDLEAMIETFCAHDREHHDTSVRAFPGAGQALVALRAVGVKTGVVTSKGRASTARGLALAGFEGLLDALVCLEDVQKHKPDPAPILLGLEQLGVQPRDAVYVGDAPADLVAGRAAGVRTAAVAWSLFPREDLAREAPDQWVHRWADLRPAT